MRVNIRHHARALLITYYRLSDPEDPDLPYHRDRKTRPGKTVNPEALKAELKALLREPLMARGVSA